MFAMDCSKEYNFNKPNMSDAKLINTNFIKFML